MNAKLGQSIPNFNVRGSDTEPRHLIDVRNISDNIHLPFPSSWLWRSILQFTLAKMRNHLYKKFTIYRLNFWQYTQFCNSYPKFNTFSNPFSSIINVQLVSLWWHLPTICFFHHHHHHHHHHHFAVIINSTLN